ncbi:hypothetical protein RB653_003862 [Dictyostelium firmibasis]|uniref:RRM domain-containing protein n=1 Tax=Dictyostelium firmibasis TaxID=79012 RepID=A0AAN7TYH3_9MYCE
MDSNYIDNNNNNSIEKEKNKNIEKNETFHNDDLINDINNINLENKISNDINSNTKNNINMNNDNDNNFNNIDNNNCIDDDGCNLSSPKSISGKIFVGGLLKTSSNEILKDYFSQFGEVRESIVIKATEKASKSRGFGFVTFIDPLVIDEILQINHCIEGKNVEIRRAIPKEEMTEEPKKQKLFVGGLPKHITSDDFNDYFSGFGEISEYNLLTEKNGSIKGFGFICFKDESVNDIILNEPQHIILGKRVDIRIADSQIKRLQQQQTQQHHSPQHLHQHHMHSQPPQIISQYSPKSVILVPHHHQHQISPSHLNNGNVSGNQPNSFQNINSPGSPVNDVNNNNHQNGARITSSSSGGSNIPNPPIFHDGYEFYQHSMPYGESPYGSMQHQNSTYYPHNYMMVPVLYPYPPYQQQHDHSSISQQHNHHSTNHHIQTQHQNSISNPPTHQGNVHQQSTPSTPSSSSSTKYYQSTYPQLGYSNYGRQAYYPQQHQPHQPHHQQRAIYLPYPQYDFNHQSYNSNRIPKHQHNNNNNNNNNSNNNNNNTNNYNNVNGTSEKSNEQTNSHNSISPSSSYSSPSRRFNSKKEQELQGPNE